MTNSITLAGTDGPVLVMDANVTLLRNGATVTLAGIQVNDKIRAATVKNGTTITALAVSATAP
jgi:hypothetical protein